MLISWTSQVALVVKNLPAYAGDMRDEGSIFGWGRSLEEGMVTHSNILVLEVPWTEDLVGYSPWSCKESDTTEQLN